MIPTRHLSLWAVGLSLLLSACASAYLPWRSGHGPGVATIAQTFSDAGLKRLTADMDPAMLALARRHDPVRRADLWGRPLGWASLNVAAPPDLGFGTATDQTAMEINALRPFAKGPILPMRPFVIDTGAGDRERALTCLTQAVYYESAREPELGQEAVAQVVLNRLRHPAYPKSVCGVVYQGAARQTGCQFTFTCDGSLTQVPEAGLWAQARTVAERALAGFVTKEVGSATHYHAVYVAPYWAPTLVKMKQIGAHIFYRWTGPWGEPAAFTGRYAGGEDQLSFDILSGWDKRTQGAAPPAELAVAPPPRVVTLTLEGESRTYSVAEPGGLTPGGSGMLYAPRRKPTAEEIRRINESLARIEAEQAVPARPNP